MIRLALDLDRLLRSPAKASCAGLTTWKTRHQTSSHAAQASGPGPSDKAPAPHHHKSMGSSSRQQLQLHHAWMTSAFRLIFFQFAAAACACAGARLQMRRIDTLERLVAMQVQHAQKSQTAFGPNAESLTARL